MVVAKDLTSSAVRRTGEGWRMICNDYGDRPGCLRDADDRYTMRFDDIGESPIYWCTFCGPVAHAMSKAITKATEERGTEFTEKFADAIRDAQEKQVKN